MAHTILHWNGFDAGNNIADDYQPSEFRGLSDSSYTNNFFGITPFYGVGKFHARINSFLRLMPHLPGGPFTTLAAQMLFGVRFTGGGSNVNIMRFQDLVNQVEQISLYLNWNGSNFDLQIRRGPTVLGTVPNFTPHSQWFWISAMVHVDDTAGVIKIRSGLNDQIVFTFTGDTMNSSLKALHAVDLGDISGTFGGLFIDDVVISTCSPSDDPMPRYRVLGAEMPTDNDIVACSVFGASNNYQAVNETSPNDDTSYVYSSTPGTKDTYTRNWTSFTNTPLAVRVEARARKNDAGIRSLRNILKRGTTEFEGAAQALDSQYFPVRTEWQQDPLSGDAWRPGRFNSADMKFGFKIE